MTTARWTRAILVAFVVAPVEGSFQSPSAPAGSKSRFGDPVVTLRPADCAVARLGDAIPVGAIGEAVSSVTLLEPRWVPATDSLPARCEVDGRIAPVDTGPTARSINVRVWLPAEWNRRAVQQGGGGMNGVIPDLRGAPYPIRWPLPGTMGIRDLRQRFRPPIMRSANEADADSRRPAPRPRGAEGQPVPAAEDWALNEEAIANLGYLQLKKTHDAAMVLIERAYGERPRFNYFTGTSQGGREALTVSQRYPADYHGIIANVPIVGFSSLMLAPELIRIREKPSANWVTRAKVNAIRAAFMRQCDHLDGLTDGVISDYQTCRAIFDVSQGARNRHPWAATRCPGNRDPDPTDTSPKACLTDGQIGTLELVYSRYRFATPLAHGAKTFGMWVPNTDPSGSGLIADARFRGQEGAPPDAPLHAHLGVLGVTGFLMRELVGQSAGLRGGRTLEPPSRAAVGAARFD